MIGQLRGNVEQVTKDRILLDVSGVGYILRVTTDVIQKARMGEELVLRTHLSVREDALDLYGFETADEVIFFELLINVSGIGPKSALAIMNLGAVSTLQSAIRQSDIAYLTRVSGIGKKNAEKIVLELRDKVGGGEDGAHGTHREDADVVEALESLGYAKHEVREALKHMGESVSGTEDRLREALKLLGKK